jgi:D-glycero-D-manno-heptose 1,7-bisphosphate phosphatase
VDRLSAVFLDRDGTINEKAPEGDYVKRWAEFRFLPRAKEALAVLHRAGFVLVIVTNQRGIARGRMSEGDLADIHRRMLAELAEARAPIDAIYHCPHEPGTCDCRKPEIGMLLRACRELGLRLHESVVVGDSASDMEAARRAGCRGVLIAGKGGAPAARADAVRGSLWDAAQLLASGGLSQDGRSEA